MQLKNESARGGAEIELECARRDVAQGTKPERKPKWKGRLRVCRRSRRSISASSPNANGSMHHCWNLKAALRRMNTNARDIRDEQDRDQSCRKCRANWTRTCATSAIGIERGRKVERRVLRSNRRNRRGNDRPARQGFRNWHASSFRRNSSPKASRSSTEATEVARRSAPSSRLELEIVISQIKVHLPDIKVCFRRREFRELKETKGLTQRLKREC